MIAKITENNKKPTKHYREKKLGLIDRLSIALSVSYTHLGVIILVISLVR